MAPLLQVPTLLEPPATRVPFINVRQSLRRFRAKKAAALASAAANAGSADDRVKEEPF
jgi:hypothetical protein